jgi:hypothetical protein
MRMIIFLATFLWTVTGWSQLYSIGWSTSDSGGATSTGGVYALSGTAGQPDAGFGAGGSFTLAGGFWVNEPSQAEAAAVLHVELMGTGVGLLLSWPADLAGFRLQETANLHDPGTAWLDVAEAPALTEGRYQLAVPVDSTTRFYRLAKP